MEMIGNNFISFYGHYQIKKKKKKKKKRKKEDSFSKEKY